MDTPNDPLKNYRATVAMSYFLIAFMMLVAVSASGGLMKYLLDNRVTSSNMVTLVLPLPGERVTWTYPGDMPKENFHELMGLADRCLSAALFAPAYPPETTKPHISEAMDDLIAGNGSK